MASVMRQVRLNEPGRFLLREESTPTAGPGEVLLRVRRIGVCGTDLHAYRGRQPFFNYPRVLGHELGVEVVSFGSGVEGFAVGERAALEPYLACGRCRTCCSGRSNCCARLEVLGVHRDGGMQDYIAAPAALVHRSAALDFEQLALIETLGIGYHAVERARLEPGEWVVVVGAGPIGLTVVQFAALAGARVTVLDVNAGRREFSRRLGAEFVVDSSGGSAQTEAAVAEICGDELAHCVFDATGNLEVMSSSLRLAGPGGRVVMVGLALGEFRVDDPLFHRRELSIHSTRNSAGAFPAIIGLMESGKIDTRPWVTHRLALDALPSEFETLYIPEIGLVKAMITL